MFLSRPSAFFFLSNQKCASTSIRNLIEPYCDVTPRTGVIPGLKIHTSLPAAIDRIASLELDLSTLVSITTIRNPWPRVFSFYRHLKNVKSQSKFWSSVIVNCDSFDVFLGRDDVKAALSNLAADNFCFDSRSGNRVQHIIAMERLHEELPPILAQVGVEGELQHARNQGGSSDYVDQYTDQARAVVGDIFAADIELGGYTFDMQ